MRERHVALDAAVPAELEAALAGDVVALLGVLVAAAVRAPPRAGLPAEGERGLPRLVHVLLVRLVLLLLVLLLPAGLARHAGVRPVLALAAEPVVVGAGEVGVVVSVVEEHALLAASVLALVDVRVIAREELEELVVRFLGETLLEDISLCLCLFIAIWYLCTCMLSVAVHVSLLYVVMMCSLYVVFIV